MKTKRINYQIDLINGAYDEKKRTAPNAIRHAYNATESLTIRNNDSNALFAIQRLSGRIKRTNNIIKNTGLNFGSTTDIP